jgi:hypothetical protein
MQASSFPHSEHERVTFHLNKDFYSESALKVASEDFSENFTTQVDTLPQAFSVCLTPKNDAAKRLMGTIGFEFANYALSLMQADQ